MSNTASLSTASSWRSHSRKSFRNTGTSTRSRTRLSAAVDAGADLIGVNNRDLARLEVDLATFERVAPAAPEGATLLAESGIATPDDAARMRRAGADGLLIGTAIMDGDPRANARRLTTPAGDESGRNPGSERRP